MTFIENNLLYKQLFFVLCPGTLRLDQMFYSPGIQGQTDALGHYLLLCPLKCTMVNKNKI